MAISLGRIENFQEMEVWVSGPGRANRLFIYTGIAVFNFKGDEPASAWKKDSIEFELGRVFAPGQVRDVVATASLNSINNYSTAVHAGWAVDRVMAQWDLTEQRIKLLADLAVRDVDGYIQRMGFQVTVLASI